MVNVAMHARGDDRTRVHMTVHEPAASILAIGRVPGGVTNVCIRLVAGLLVGLADRVCGDAAVPLAEEALCGVYGFKQKFPSRTVSPRYWSRV